MRLTRKVTFSSGHRFWKSSLSEQLNKKLFGGWASPFNHGHNFVLSVSVEGNVNEATGMVINIKDIDEMLKMRVVNLFAQKSINDEIEWFKNTTPCLENLMPYIAGLIEEHILGAFLVQLKLEETPLFYGEWNRMDGKVTLTRVYEFCASHRLHLASLSDKENQRLFGKCNNPSGHGHNYILEVTFSGDQNQETGISADIVALDNAVEERILSRYDHKHLNSDVPELAGKNPTSEIVAREIFRHLDGNIPARLERILLKETDRSWFEVFRGDV